MAHGGRYIYQTLSIDCQQLFFYHLYLTLSFVLSFLSLVVFVFVFILSHSFDRAFFVDDVPLIFPCPAHHVSDWQPPIFKEI